jgi:protein TonB
VSYRQAPQPPVYPKTALRRKQQGEVLVQALVSEEGNTEQVEVVRSSGVASLDASALKAVSGWVFEAAKMDGRPIRAWIEVPVAFELRR